MRICLLTPQDLDTVPFPDNDWPCDPRPFVPEADWHVATLEKPGAARQVARIVREGGFDVYFNLCSGSAEEPFEPGIEVVRTLERYGVPFTGAASSFHEPTRRAMKRACLAAGIDTPAWAIVRTDRDIERAAARLRFPLFVKHHCSYASVSLSRASRVMTPAGLMRQAHKMIARHGAALIEEYVAGRECTVLVAENADDPRRPLTYTPVEYSFPEGEEFKHSDLKWETFEGMSAHPVADPLLDRQLRAMSARFFTAIEGSSFARCDIRVDGDGRPWMLEINPNCGIYYPPHAAGGADVCLAHDPAGHEGFTRQLIRAGLRRHARLRRARRRKAA
ncbi:MAG TPA: hypothetical protein PLQ13_05545 [Candidatus Krumholzibacteria bacterium]|nr:hypothetical protein [Candidatus Krumholzibacteria bacterium]